MSKTLEQRIAEAREERDLLRFVGERQDHWPAASIAATDRLLARAERRLRDLEAVRDGRAVEAWATCAVDGAAAWAAYGAHAHSIRDRFILSEASYRPGDRITVLRGIAYKPVSTVDEVEAESEET